MPSLLTQQNMRRRDVPPHLRQQAKQELVSQVKRGISVREARTKSAVLMHRTTVYRLRVSSRT